MGIKLTETKEIEEIPIGEETNPLKDPVTIWADNIPDGLNPLTGLPAKNTDLLSLPPALVSVSNFPASARPQAGLNSCPIVFEMAIGYGMTRFLAVFYGGFPGMANRQIEEHTSVSSANEAPLNDQLTEEVALIGPIRSGRLPYENIRSSFSGFLVMASAYETVSATLSQTTSIYGSDQDDIDSALIDVNHLLTLAQSRGEGYHGSHFSLEGMFFTEIPPDGGNKADMAWIFYSNLNQIQWRYDEESGAYIRYDIKTDSSGEFTMGEDRLTGEPLTRENVIIIYAEHDYQAPTLINIDLINKPPGHALLFRDGEVHEIFWTTQFGDYEKETGLLHPIRFVDGEGNPFGLKPGQTWIHFVSTASYHTESAIGETPFQPIIEEIGSGLWLVRYKGKY
jgi:hypothetical protein